jgi:DNA-binding IclR family transcriptional regulator
LPALEIAAYLRDAGPSAFADIARSVVLDPDVALLDLVAYLRLHGFAEFDDATLTWGLTAEGREAARGESPPPVPSETTAHVQRKRGITPGKPTNASRILALLEATPWLPFSEIHTLLNEPKTSIGCVLGEMRTRGQLVTVGKPGERKYALPGTPIDANGRNTFLELRATVKG